MLAPDKLLTGTPQTLRTIEQVLVQTASEPGELLLSDQLAPHHVRIGVARGLGGDLLDSDIALLGTQFDIGLGLNLEHGGVHTDAALDGVGRVD